MTHQPPSVTPDSSAKPEADSASSPSDPTRRKLGLGLGATAIFTLASRPVLASVQCATASKVASGNLSSPGTHSTCSGKTVLTWLGTSPSQYPGGNVNFHISLTPPTLNGVFKVGTNADWGNKNLKQVMQASDGTLKPNPISAEFAAALLNIRDKRIPAAVLDEGKLIGMWNEWVGTGVYTPKAYAQWHATEIVRFLRSLQG